MPVLLRLFFAFFKTGLFALGGGLATLPFLYDMVGQYHWFTKGDIVNMLAVSESTPGPIGVNMSTYVGFHIDGVLGSLCSTGGLVLPSIIICILISKMLKKFKDNPYVNRSFYGIRAVVAGLIVAATLQVFQVALLEEGAGIKLDFKAVLFFVILYIGSKLFEKRGKSLHPIVIILISGAVGIFVMGA